MNLFGGKSKADQIEEQHDQIQHLEQELAALKAEQEQMQELFRHLDRDRELLLKATQVLKPGRSAKELSEALLELSFRPFDLASFYVALIDLEKDQLSFPMFHEGGKSRSYPPKCYSANKGLTGKAIDSGKPMYIRSTEEAAEQGAIFTPAEKASGLIPQSWYGVPLLADPKALGLVAFMSFQADAFSESRRSMLDAMSGLLAMALVFQTAQD